MMCVKTLTLASPIVNQQREKCRRHVRNHSPAIYCRDKIEITSLKCCTNDLKILIRSKEAFKLGKIPQVYLVGRDKVIYTINYVQ